MNKINLKVSVFVIFLLIVAPSAFADVVNWITPKPAISIVSGATFEAGKDVSPRNVFVDLSSALAMKELNCFAGFQFQTSIFDFTSSVTYAPTFFNHFNFGPKMIFHSQHYDDIYLELDLLGGAYLKYTKSRKFAVALDFLYHFKCAKIFSIEDSVPWLVNTSIAFCTTFTVRPFSPLCVEFTISSYSDYRYMLFFAPDFRLSTEYDFSRAFSLGSEIEIQYIDMFTLSSNINVINARLYVKLRLNP